MKKKNESKFMKKVLLPHIKEDSKEFKKQLADDRKLKKQVKKQIKEKK